MYQYNYSDELYHYGVLGMKWGIRRDARLLANRRRNKKVRKIKNQYELGNITKQQRKQNIKDANREKKDYIRDVNSQIQKTRDKNELRKTQTNLARLTMKEVPHRKLKKGLAVASQVLTGVQLGSVGANAATLISAGAMANPVIGGAVIGAVIGSSIHIAGANAVRQMLIDKAT